MSVVLVVSEIVVVVALMLSVPSALPVFLRSSGPVPQLLEVYLLLKFDLRLLSVGIFNFDKRRVAREERERVV